MIAFPATFANLRGRALPIWVATRSRPDPLNLYERGKVWSAAAYIAVSGRASLGCPKRPFEAFVHPLVMVGDAAFQSITPYTSNNRSACRSWHASPSET